MFNHLLKIGGKFVFVVASTQNKQVEDIRLEAERRHMLSLCLECLLWSQAKMVFSFFHGQDLVFFVKIVFSFFFPESPRGRRWYFSFVKDLQFKGTD